MKGFIYILSNQFMPDLIKIGYTKTNPEDDAKEISSYNNIPAPFKVNYKIQVNNASQKEEEIYELLKASKVNGNRGFFKLSVDEAIEVIDELINGEKNMIIQDLERKVARLEEEIIKRDNIIIELSKDLESFVDIANKISYNIKELKKLVPINYENSDFVF